MDNEKLPEWLDLETVPEEDRAEALEAWNKKWLEVRLHWENKIMGKLNKQDNINCDYCRNRGWVSVLQAVHIGDRVHYTTATKPCRCRYSPFRQGRNDNG